LQELPFADVQAERGARDAKLFPFEQLNEAVDQLHRQIIHAEVAQIFKDVHRRRHSGAAQAGDDDELGSHCHWSVVSCQSSVVNS